ncbi:unnamed protein product [Strongylus vulgaris]|uniref:Uncharacterized protein n=1 Tax=Strongylus vulgaris TaxID=40348 RepID=A0A3P7J084_STRVU|nr:unnamed protein product [Strongylus vulgaris]
MTAISPAGHHVITGWLPVGDWQPVLTISISALTDELLNDILNGSGFGSGSGSGLDTEGSGSGGSGGSGDSELGSGLDFGSGSGWEEEGDGVLL